MPRGTSLTAPYISAYEDWVGVMPNYQVPKPSAQLPTRSALPIALGVAFAVAWAFPAFAQQSPVSPGRDILGLGARGLLEQFAPGAAPGVGPGAPGGPQPSGGTRVYGGRAAAVQTIGGDKSGIRIKRGQTGKDFSKDHPVVYGEPPKLEEEAPMTLFGPMTMTEFLNTLNEATGWNILPTPEVEQITLRFWLNNMTPTQSLEVLRFHDIYYEYNPETNFLYVMTKDQYLKREHGALVEAQFPIRHVGLEDAETLVESLMSPEGRLVTDLRQSILYVTDTFDNIAQIERVLDGFDVEREHRAFELVNLDPEAVTDLIESMLTEGGQVTIDPRTNVLLVTDRPNRVEEIAQILSLLDKELETRTWVLNYALPGEIADRVADFLPQGMGTIYANDQLYQITVTAVPSRLDEIDKMIRLWDVKKKQVQIEAYLVTASTNVARNLGVSWAYYGVEGDKPFGIQVGTPLGGSMFDSLPESGQRAGIGQFPRLVPERDSEGNILEDLFGNPIIREFRGNDVAITLNYLETKGDVTILSRPHVTVQDGQEAVFENTTQVPFAQATTSQPVGIDPDTGFRDFREIARIDFIDVGTILRVVPRIAEDRNILMEISAEDSTFTRERIVSAGQNNDVPQKTQNKTQTQVLVHDASTIVIGGLRSSNFSNTDDKVPLLGDIPILGRAFRTTTKARKHNELLIFITPTIVDEFTQPEAVRLARADEDLARTMRFDNKSALRRAVDRVSRGRDEILVTVGQTGELFSNGTLITLADLRTQFFKIKDPAATRIVIRKHPKAPGNVVDQVVELGLEANLKVEFDDRVIPFVPSLPAGGH